MYNLIYLSLQFLSWTTWSVDDLCWPLPQLLVTGQGIAVLLLTTKRAVEPAETHKGQWKHSFLETKQLGKRRQSSPDVGPAVNSEDSCLHRAKYLNSAVGDRRVGGRRQTAPRRRDVVFLLRLRRCRPGSVELSDRVTALRRESAPNIISLISMKGPCRSGR